ncbi:condensation protein [Pseudaminobacter arsenicus]|uniref:Condensation protein n=1 Tax=Borborobacter arsenicus TaxID=1851146 RepID=A0A432VBU0_9HYPH|nr:condensation domain-containing protein [Pseudaminobacter arsenicus]RUM99563.1 condensation protein [Pseudaminobacter arsenicus]
MKQDQFSNIAGDTPTVVGEFPCTHTQQRCWFLDQLNPGNPALNVAVRWEIRGRFKIKSIESAFQQIVDRHEILRTRFIVKDGQPFQQVVDKVDFKMSVIDLRNVPAEQRDERVQSIGRETASIPFDLRNTGLFRITFLQVDNERGFILITAHQICFDGWSIRVLGRELGEFAAAIDEQRQPRLDPLPLQYGDYAMWQDEYLTSYGFEAEKTFWQEQLGDAPYFEVAPDHPRGERKSYRGDIISLVLPKDFGERMDRAARARQMSIYGYGSGVISALLHRFTGEREVLFGTQIAGRDDVDLENLIGVFINNLVLRFNIADETSFDAHIGQANEVVSKALNHQRMPFNKLVELVNPHRDPSRNPLISVNFNLQKAFLENAHYGDFELISAPSQSPGVIYDLSFIMIGRPDHWRMSIEYNTDLFDKSTAEEFLRLWQATYELALENPSAKLSSIPIRPRQAPTPGVAESQGSLIERLLCQHPAVAEAITVPFPGKPGGTYAFIVPRKTTAERLEGLPAKLLTHLNATLAGKDMPMGVSIILDLPKNEQGEIDLSKLPIPDEPAPEAAPILRGSLEEIEKQVASIWAEMLSLDMVGPEDDFFALGGHSLLALRMLAAVNGKFGIRPDLALLFRASTLRDFVQTAFGAVMAPSDPSVSPSHWDMSVYRPGNDGTVIYTLNHPLLYFQMAREIGGETGVSNVHMFNTTITDEMRSLSMEEIAAELIQSMRIDEQDAPIGLVGLCVNGIVALEVAHQLTALGKDVRFVAMIDSWAPGYVTSLNRFTRWRWNLEKRVKRAFYFTGKLLSGRMPVTEYFKEFRLSLSLLTKIGLIGAPSREEVQTVEVTDYLVAASRRYHPNHYPGKGRVLLFRSQANHPRAARLRFGWGELLPKTTEVFDLRGWHEDSLSSIGIKRLAGVISEKLDG